MGLAPIEGPRVSHNRLYIDRDQWSQTIQLDSSQKRYLLGVLRLNKDSLVEVFDGLGNISQAVLIDPNEGLLRLGPVTHVPSPQPQVTLGLALLKSAKTDLVIRMATELGVACIWPFVCDRAVAKTNPNKVERWRTIAIEAARQCGRATVPTIELPASFAQIVDQAKPNPDRKSILFFENGEAVLPSNLFGDQRLRIVIVGPEGGFTQQEAELAKSFNIQIVKLDLPILQAQTAAIVATSLACVL